MDYTLYTESTAVIYQVLKQLRKTLIYLNEKCMNYDSVFLAQEKMAVELDAVCVSDGRLFM